ncbi:transposase [Candidatus Chloroploca sp. Khr17]|uniref:IS66 family transposase n=1 Tax=Candidatus Chloroploca sp. Khr17 TaxID=2496869 RepID=UPI00101DB617|nr:transposase [Candidatus Chloroploca sp. Khr17]
MQIPDINPDTIPDVAMRQIVIQLLNVIETLAAENAALRVENQQLRDDVARLTGRSAKPDIKPPTPPSPPPADHSSEAERRTRTPRGKPKKNATLIVTHEERCVVDPATLPPDAVRHGTTEVIVQRLHMAVEVVRFTRDVWYVPSTNTTITAPLPPGYRGGFCPTIHALVPALGHGANVSQPALLTFLRDVGLTIGTGTVARMLLDPDGFWADEAAAIHQTGLATGSWVATDQTSTRVDGQNEVCHVVGNALFTSYHTRPGGTRQDVLAVLWGQELRYRLNDEALAWLQASSLPRTLFRRLREALPHATDMTAAELQQHLLTAGITLNPQQQQQVGDALAVAAYHAQTQVPVLGWLLSDDAPVYDHLTDTHALCWVHDWRHYAKLAPRVPQHQAELKAFGDRYWTFYRDLLAYQQAPSATERARLEDAFDALVEDVTGYAALDDRISKTADKRAQLLAVLKHPDLPLHNNAMELAARRRVRKRDVSFGPQSRTGARAWDTFQTLAATAAKLGVGFFHYLRDRIVTPATTPTLAERLAQRAGIAAQPAA